jgi:hypothetical protein
MGLGIDLRCENYHSPMVALGHQRRRQPRASFDPLPQCPESGLRVSALVSVAKGQYTKMLADATKRNRIFFDKLNLVDNH